jgi:hypothetical protein
MASPRPLKKHHYESILQSANELDPCAKGHPRRHTVYSWILELQRLKSALRSENDSNSVPTDVQAISVAYS